MDLELRHKKRYEQLVRSHMITSDMLSAGVKSSLKSRQSFNETQAAWRFFNNERCELGELAKPLVAHGVKHSEDCAQYGLMVHDWSGLSYKKHTSKKDRYGVHNEEEYGYELQASLLLNDETGSPIAPIALNVVTAERVLSTYTKEANRAATHIEELAKRIHYIEEQPFKTPLVHIIDREGDSVELMRDLEGKKWLIRCRSNRHVTYQDVSIRVDKLANQLVFNQARTIHYKGQEAKQYLASTQVLVTRMAQPKRKKEGKPKQIKGEAVPCHFIVSKIQNKEGKIVAWWYLLSNVEVDSTTLTLWYYWRWSIETFFKLLKSAGMHLESWQQETGEAIARRLLVACMA
ncbi:transposase, partial [Alicyclobacillus cellulosilyticus]